MFFTEQKQNWQKTTYFVLKCSHKLGFQTSRHIINKSFFCAFPKTLIFLWNKRFFYSIKKKKLSNFNIYFILFLDHNTKLKASPVWDLLDLKPLESADAAKPNLTIDQLTALVENMADIKAEVGELAKNLTSGEWAKSTRALIKNGVMHQQWFYTWGKKKHSTCSEAPKSCKILKSVTSSSKCKKCNQKILILDPETTMLHHTGPTNQRLR